MDLQALDFVYLSDNNNNNKERICIVQKSSDALSYCYATSTRTEDNNGSVQGLTKLAMTTDEDRCVRAPTGRETAALFGR